MFAFFFITRQSIDFFNYCHNFQFRECFKILLCRLPQADYVWHIGNSFMHVLENLTAVQAKQNKKKQYLWQKQEFLCLVASSKLKMQ